MKKIIFLFLLVLTGCVKTESTFEIKETPAITDYYIDASLNGETLEVIELINYYNDKADFDELKVNVYPAAHYESDFRLDYVKVNELEIEYEFRGTVLSFDLEETLEVGDDLLIEIGYRFDYWPEGRLANYDEDFVSMFFYPYVAYYDDGWQTDDYSFYGEAYFNDVGNYYVSLELPKDYFLATGGTIVEKDEGFSTTNYEIELLNARDYSFSFSENYHIYDKEIYGIDVKIMSLTSLSPIMVDDLFEVTASVIAYTDEKVGPYPYESLTLEFGHIYGMESSSIIYCSTDISFTTVIHELYHQWFFGIIGGDQASTPWLDEGITSFMTGLYYMDNAEMYADDYWGRYSIHSGRYDNVLDDKFGTSALRGVHEYVDDYGLMVYVYGARVIKHFVDTELNGDYDLMLEVMENYYDAYKFEEPTVDDFLDIVVETTGKSDAKEWFMDYLTEMKDIN